MGERIVRNLEKSRPFSGRPPEEVELWTDGDAGFSVILLDGTRYVIPGSAVFKRVADYIRNERINMLDEHGPVAILGVRDPDGGE